MKKLNIVLLDRATFSRSVAIPEPSFPHNFTSYDYCTIQERVSRLKGVQAVLTNKVPIDEALLSQCPELEYVGVAATGYNIIDLDACRAHGVAVTNVKAYSTDGVAEHVFMFILALRKQLKAYQQSLVAGTWSKAKQFTYFHEPIENLKGTRLGLIGTGAIAQAVAKLASAFGMDVLWHSPSGRQELNGHLCLPLVELLQQSDIVSLHCPLTAKTENLIDHAALALMKPSALLINTARGPVVDSLALADALRNGTIAGAGIDVLPIEPPAEEEPLLACLDLPNLLMTAHTAWASKQSQEALLAQLMQNLELYVAGEALDNLAV
ncbi:D-2-hydroxyacid dehydrogenase [Agaribacterium sp. ZY112]|uniref:D-2-hydroxyacid dehydrogenase n=1 Tax=Agaribacterium sp. ZY112 TaxID=3233574 RepID=UPI0035252065